MREDFTAAEVEVETFMEQALPAPSQMMPETSPIMLLMQWLICSNWPPSSQVMAAPDPMAAVLAAHRAESLFW